MKRFPHKKIVTFESAADYSDRLARALTAEERRALFRIVRDPEAADAAIETHDARALARPLRALARPETLSPELDAWLASRKEGSP